LEPCARIRHLDSRRILRAGDGFVRLKKVWTKPVVRHLDPDEPGEMTPRKRRAIQILKTKAKKSIAADD